MSHPVVPTEPIEDVEVETLTDQTYRSSATQGQRLAQFASEAIQRGDITPRDAAIGLGLMFVGKLCAEVVVCAVTAIQSRRRYHADDQEGGADRG